MKKNIHHPNYREVVFKDITVNEMFIIKSAVTTSETITLEDKKYPLFIVDTSSKSHAFYTGNKHIARSTGRVERFNRRFESKNSKTK